jgi:hypothetical protein
VGQGDLVTAYLDGQISRRTLVRRLVAAGVSFGAAVSYAHVLNPERASARADSDHYPDTTVRLVSTDIDKVLDQGRLIVRVRADEDAELSPLRIRCYHKTAGPSYTKIAEKEMDFNGPDTKNVGVPLLPAAAGLKSLNKARVQVDWVGYDDDGKLPNGSFVSIIRN